MIVMAKVCSKAINFAIAESIHQLLVLRPHPSAWSLLVVSFQSPAYISCSPPTTRFENVASCKKHHPSSCERAKELIWKRYLDGLGDQTNKVLSLGVRQVIPVWLYNNIYLMSKC